MHQGLRWLLAAAVTLTTFSAVLWLSAVVLLPLWAGPAAGRWVIGAGLGGAAAALAALWGAGFAQGDRAEDPAAPAGRPGCTGQGTATPGGVTQVANVSGGSVVGQGARDQVVNIQMDRGR